MFDKAASAAFMTARIFNEAQFLLENDVFDNRTIIVDVYTGGSYEGTEFGGTLAGDYLFADIPTAAESIIAADYQEIFRGFLPYSEHTLKYTRFFIAQEKHGPSEEHRMTGGECGEDEVCQFVDVDGGQHGITELIEQRQFSKLFAGCVFLRRDPVCH